MAWIKGQSQISKASPGRMQTPFKLFYMYSSLQALDVLQTGVQAAPSLVSVWKSEDGKRSNDLYSVYNASRSSKKKLFVSTRTVFLSIPAPYLCPRPRHIYLRPRVLSQAKFCGRFFKHACMDMHIMRDAVHFRTHLQKQLVFPETGYIIRSQVHFVDQGFGPRYILLHTFSYCRCYKETH